MEHDYNRLEHYLDVLDLLFNVHFQTTNSPEECAAWSDFLEDYHRLLSNLIDVIRKTSVK